MSSDKNNIKVCPLCGSGLVTEEMKCKDYFVSGETFPIYSCGECGFRFTGNVPSEDKMGHYYQSNSYISHSDTRKGIINKIYHWVRSLMLKEKSSLVIHFTGLKKGNLLDYGTGTGYFPNRMKKKGWNVEAIEVSEDARTFAFEHFGLKPKLPSEMDSFGEKSFDCITLWHVLEHIQDLHGIMDKFNTLLREQGMLIIAVPNRTSYDAGRYGNMWAAYDVPRHLWHFSPVTLANLGSMHGFSLVEMITMPFDGFYISMMSEKNRGSRFPFLKGMFYGAAGWLSTLGKRERSSSLIYVFKKK